MIHGYLTAYLAKLAEPVVIEPFLNSHLRDSMVQQSLHTSYAMSSYSVGSSSAFLISDFEFDESITD
jgi:hypothetical protein